MTASWPCSTCGEPGIRNVYARGYCAAHLAALYRTLTPSVWLAEGGGVGLPELARPDYGSGFYEVHCSACRASWVDAAFTRCPWCEATIANLARWRADGVLRPPDLDPDDRLYDARMKAWADRMAVAVEARIITKDEARRAWERAVSRVA